MTYRFQILVISLGTSQKICSLLITTLCCHDDTLWYMYLMSHQRFSVVTEFNVNTKYPMLKILIFYRQQAQTFTLSFWFPFTLDMKVCIESLVLNPKSQQKRGVDFDETCDTE